MEREEVYKVIDGEREYQDERWSADNHAESRDSLDRTVDEFALYIQRYANNLTDVAGTTDKNEDKLDVVRKIAGLCVACGEKHGLPERK